MGKKQFDCIIVGQGLAGSALAVQFLLRKKKVLVIDQPSRNNSSIIAAGLFNPITGKKMNKTWMADVLFPYLKSFYQQVEQICGVKFFHSIPIYRPFIAVAEQNEWMGRSEEKSVAEFVKNIFTTSQHGDHLNDELGGLLLTHSGYIETKRYIGAVRDWLQQEGCYSDEIFDFAGLSVVGEEVFYGQSMAPSIVFCDGARGSSNKFFEWLPIRHLKGETLSITAKFLTDVLVNRGVYIAPEGTEGRWRVGSTYEYDFQDLNPTEKGRHELEANLKMLLKTEYSVVGHDAGVRPVTPDRKPILGRHPEQPTILIFNGMGTKGVSLTPYFSEILYRALDKSGVINKDVDISRYKSLYWNSR